MTWLEEFHEAAADYLRCLNRPVKEVTLVQQELPDDNFCPTCGSDHIVVNIYYTDPDGGEHMHTFWGDLGELMRALT